MYKIYEETGNIDIADNSSSDDDQINTQRPLIRRTPNTQKYVRTQRKRFLDPEICDSSSDELNEPDLLQQENRVRLSNQKRLKTNNKKLPMPSNSKYQPLSVAVSARKMPLSPTMPCSVSDVPTVSKLGYTTPPSTCQAAWHSLKNTLTTLKRSRRGVLQTSKSNCSYQEALEGSTIKYSTVPSIEANLTTSSESQQTPNSARKSFSVQRKQRCLKGGYLHEYKQLMQKERMDRRSLAHNQRLGISSGLQVVVVDINESFGAHMARVHIKNEEKSIYNIIVAPSMAPNIGVGSTLELYFDLSSETALQLRNKELVYLQPNKIVLL